MNKRGQATIFIIIALVLIALFVGGYFLLKNKSSEKPLPNYAVEVYTFTSNCIENSFERAVFNFGENGGYFLPPELSTEGGIPYYYYHKKSFLPSEEKLELEFSKEFEFLTETCVNGFQDFDELEINYSEIKSETSINEEKISLKINYPISVKKGEEDNFINDFGTFENDFRLGEIYDATSEIISAIDENTDFCLNCFSEIALEHNIKIDIQNPYNSTLIFAIEDKEFEGKGEPFKFYFAVENDE